MPDNKRPEYFDVPFGIASAIMTTGLNTIATTESYYYGVSVKASAADCQVTVYDSAGATSGNLLDLVFVDTSIDGLGKRSDLRNPVKAKLGITVDVTEDGATGVVFYAPKG
ncbi:hypothetical protein LCGC14_1185040 [marine sediment metagenome]|uniref:Uncharacterized protein n=1 Tax=marine sediment metagenome TaxID=412755 RepID=A0A0F9PRF3_9ZZZZ